MPGWDSLQTVTAAHGTFQLVGLILLVIAATLAGFVAYQLRNGVWPEWLDVGAYQLRSRFFLRLAAPPCWRCSSSPKSRSRAMAFARVY